MKQKQNLQHEVRELHSHIQVDIWTTNVNKDSLTRRILCQEAERKEREKQESLVKGLEEGVREKAVQSRRDYAAVQHAAVEERREEIR